MRSPTFDLPPLWRESRVGFEFAGLMRSPVWRGEGVQDGKEQPVMLVSGLLANDESLGWMARWLRSQDFWIPPAQRPPQVRKHLFPRP